MRGVGIECKFMKVRTLCMQAMAFRRDALWVLDTWRYPHACMLGIIDYTPLFHLYGT